MLFDLAFLEEALATGRIHPSKLPIGAPVFFVKKKDGKLQFVQDYCALNAITQKNRYPLPIIDDLIHRLQGTWYFMKLDVRWGYNNVRIKEGNEWKAVRARPCKVVKGSTKPSKTCEVFEGLVQDASRFLTEEIQS